MPNEKHRDFNEILLDEERNAHRWLRVFVLVAPIAMAPAFVLPVWNWLGFSLFSNFLIGLYFLLLIMVEWSYIRASFGSPGRISSTWVRWSWKTVLSRFKRWPHFLFDFRPCLRVFRTLILIQIRAKSLRIGSALSVNCQNRLGPPIASFVNDAFPKWTTTAPGLPTALVKRITSFSYSSSFIWHVWHPYSSLSLDWESQRSFIILTMFVDFIIQNSISIKHLDVKSILTLHFYLIRMTVLLIWDLDRY